MSGSQIATLHSPDADHESSSAAQRAARRTLQALSDERLLIRLHRRVGGVRGGSNSFIYAIGPVGQRLIESEGPRKRFREPSTTFAEHTLAVADHVVGLAQSAGEGRFELVSTETEPRSWRDFTTTAGRGSLRPDLFVILGVGDYEYRWFIEVDLGTEHLPALLRKCRVYQAYFQTGLEQGRHGVFPRVCWSMNDPTRVERLRKAVVRDPDLSNELFTCVHRSDLVATLSKGLP